MKKFDPANPDSIDQETMKQIEDSLMEANHILVEINQKIKDVFQEETMKLVDGKKIKEYQEKSKKLEELL